MKSILPLLLLASLSACSWFERPAPYADSRSASALKVPEGLDRPTPDPALQIEPGKGGVLGTEAQLPPNVDPASVKRNTGAMAPEQLVATCKQPLADCFKRIEEAFDESRIYAVKLADAASGQLSISTEEVTRKGRWWLFGAGRRATQHEFLIQFVAQAGETRVEVMDGTGNATLNPRARVIMDQIKQLLAQ